MATLYIAEFANLAGALNGGVGQIAKVAPETEQQVTIGAASVPSAAFGSTTRLVRLHTDAICSIAFGTAPTATAAKMRLAADQTEYFAVNASDKVAVITNT